MDELLNHFSYALHYWRIHLHYTIVYSLLDDMQYNCVPLGNTRVITQSSLQTFQEEMGRVINDPYKVVILLVDIVYMIPY